MRAAATALAASRGYDGGKKVPGPKRHIMTDTLGLLLDATNHLCIRHQLGVLGLRRRPSAACLPALHECEIVACGAPEVLRARECPALSPPSVRRGEPRPQRLVALTPLSRWKAPDPRGSADLPQDHADR
ncbi:hypothetical protein [Streptomyces sp. KM273126]|uniref:hypothetical protein n=1 Tax=Streptomyces sp. KM273126 TaxID=2545247 RepID=UPI00215D931F|nr:hypothetical protein [Streptomyces sp. KM273126]